MPLVAPQAYFQRNTGVLVIQPVRELNLGGNIRNHTQYYDGLTISRIAKLSEWGERVPTYQETLNGFLWNGFSIPLIKEIVSRMALPFSSPRYQ